MPIKLQTGGGRDGKDTLINPSYPEVHDKAFGILLYLFNHIQIQTGQQAADIGILKSISPHVFPETTTEEKDWKNFRKIAETCFSFEVGAIGTVAFQNFEAKFIYAKAFANFADAKNTDDPISKYERLYKVVESFFSGRGDQFDKNVADFMVQFDTNFVPNNFGELRKLRNRCIHSKDKKHVTSGDLDLLEEVTAATEKLERIADLLLQHK